MLDDDESLLFLVSQYLGLDGHEVLTATTADQALKFVDEGSPELALLDYRMPGMTGVEFMKKLRARPKGARIPVIFLTGEPPNSFAHELPGLGRLKVLNKPIDFALLGETMKELLSLRL